MTLFRAVYFDGKTAAAQDIGVSLANGALLLEDADGTALARWPGEDLVPSQRLMPGGAVVLRCRGRAEAVLQVEDTGFAAALLDAMPKLKHAHLYDPATAARGGALYRPGWWAVSLPLLVLVLLVALGPELLVRVYPQSVKSDMGRAAVATLLGGAPVCGGHAGMLALENLVQRLQGEDALPVTISVIDDDSINAFAAPGGHLVIMRGLIDVLAHEGELAFVLGHELSHLDNEDALRAVVREQGVTAMLRAIGGGSNSATRLAGSLLNMAHTRHVEERADRDAVAMMRRSTIAPGDISTLFARLTQGGSGEEGPEFIRTHPVSTNRQKLLQSILNSQDVGAAGLAAAPSPALDKEDWLAVRAVCGTRR